MNAIRAANDLLNQIEQLDRNVLAPRENPREIVGLHEYRDQLIAFRASVINAVRDIAGLDKQVASRLKDFNVYGLQPCKSSDAVLITGRS